MQQNLFYTFCTIIIFPTGRPSRNTIGGITEKHPASTTGTLPGGLQILHCVSKLPHWKQQQGWQYTVLQEKVCMHLSIKLIWSCTLFLALEQICILQWRLYMLLYSTGSLLPQTTTNAQLRIIIYGDQIGTCTVLWRWSSGVIWMNVWI